MGSFSLIHWALVLLVSILLFGGPRISTLLGDVAKGLRAFKQEIADKDIA